MTTPTALVLGLDIGGTSTRVLVADTAGQLHGAGTGPGANLTSHSVDNAFAAIFTALRDAVADIDPAEVRQAHIGTAGPANFKQPGVGAAFEDVWHGAGLTCPYEITGDPEVAFVAGTPEPDGSLLLCGTGAVAARFEDRRRIHTADAHGWLLGDMGSGFWLGREAVRSTLGTLGRLDLPGPLGRKVMHELLVAPPRPVSAERVSPGPSANTVATDPGPATESGSVTERLAALKGPADFRALADSLVMKVHSEAPIALARLAPLVSDTADDDPAAATIVREAADHLFGTLSTVRATDDGTPLVLAGSLLTSATPLRRLLEPRLAEKWPKATISAAHNGAAGAAWLAATRIVGADTEAATRLHTQLLASRLP
ncbi:N-acetylglucosamine kinase [Phytoactinopolyspora mesophila]|uniref:N-acetylglucosamine kinase n=1 Tax=Phytoactinopolyspora mesophila TaxID=2650750 RepID=UPI001391C156|nr:BadF/BadG/BcrA/BcrD ATPase family protein [Phytoactinopolyspora mesophila]